MSGLMPCCLGAHPDRQVMAGPPTLANKICVTQACRPRIAVALQARAHVIEELNLCRAEVRPRRRHTNAY